MLAARDCSDKVAQRMRAVHITLKSFSEVADVTSLKEYPAREVDITETVGLITA